MIGPRRFVGSGRHPADKLPREEPRPPAAPLRLGPGPRRTRVGLLPPPGDPSRRPTAGRRRIARRRGSAEPDLPPGRTRPRVRILGSRQVPSPLFAVNRQARKAGGIAGDRMGVNLQGNLVLLASVAAALRWPPRRLRAARPAAAAAPAGRDRQPPAVARSDRVGRVHRAPRIPRVGQPAGAGQRPDRPGRRSRKARRREGQAAVRDRPQPVPGRLRQQAGRRRQGRGAGRPGDRAVPAGGRTAPDQVHLRPGLRQRRGEPQAGPGRRWPAAKAAAESVQAEPGLDAASPPRSPGGSAASTSPPATWSTAARGRRRC